MTQRISSRRPIGRLVVTGFATLAMSAAFSGAARADDSCHKVATAKYMQWRQPRIARQMTIAYPDGKVKAQSAVFTENTLYVLDGPAWQVGPLSTQQHRVRSPEQVAVDIGLTSCAMAESAQIDGQHATAYTYRSESQDVGASAKIWISDSTGLPLRDEMSPDSPPPKWPVKMSADYTYGSEVTVPTGAELADDFRRMDGRDVLNNFLNSSPHAIK